MLAGCGGSSAPPTLAKADATPLISLAARIAAERSCAQAHDISALTQRAIALVNTGRVPAELQEQLLSGVNDLAAQAPPCVRTPPTPAPAPNPPTPHGNGKGKGHEKHGGDEDKQ